MTKSLWDGYVAQIGPTADGAQCKGAVLAPDGSTAFEVTDTEVTLDPVTSADINNDGKQDVLFDSDAGPGRCCYLYSIVTPGNTPALMRQMQTSSPLQFGDRDGDGKVEIWGHDHAFDGFDGLPRDLSPEPMVIFRLNHDMLLPVSQVFWPDYEMDINSVKGVLSQSRIDDFSGNNESQDRKDMNDQKPAEKSPEEMQRITETKALVLQVVLDYLYGGRGQEAWAKLKDWWPVNDRPRIQQAILITRARGILSEVNRPVQKSAH